MCPAGAEERGKRMEAIFAGPTRLTSDPPISLVGELLEASKPTEEILMHGGVQVETAKESVLLSC